MQVFVSEASRRWAHELDDSILRWVERYAPNKLPPKRGELRHISNERLVKILANDGIEFAALVALKGEAAAINADIIDRSHRMQEAGIPPRELKHLRRERRQIGAKIHVIDAELKRRRHLVTDLYGKTVKPLPYHFMDVAVRELSEAEFSRLRQLAVESRDQEMGLLVEVADGVRP